MRFVIELTLYLDTVGGDGAVVEPDSDVKEFLFGSLTVPLINLDKFAELYACS